MSNLSEFDIDATPPEPPRHDEPGRSPLVWVAVIVVLLAAGAGVYYWFMRPAPDVGTTATETTVPPAPQPAAPAAEAIDVPPLDESDAAVRRLIAALSAHPLIARWLVTNGLIRNMAVVVENIAYGTLPTPHLRPLRPVGPFRVLDRDGEIVLDARSYARYDGIADAVASVDTAGAARLYAALEPRLQEAYAALGRQEPFRTALERAIGVLLRVPTPPATVRLEPESAVEYRFADARLERLTQPQKQLLRMGPRNVGIIQGKLREFGLAIGMPADRLDPS